MSHPQEATEEDFAPTETQGYKVGQSKTVAELAALDQHDESLQRWKASLGLGANAGAGGSKKVVLKTLFLSSPTLPKAISIDLTQPAADLAKLKKEPLTIKEGVEYSVGITFVVENEIVSGLRFLQVVKRSGVKVDKTEAMLGSYGPQPAPYTKVFASEESPSGMLARSGTYAVRSRVTDDDNNIWLDFEWSFKLAKEW
uniref:Rho GDP-dissociation inhibitor n=1 Tax=Kwoniella bestiolae CBS 10118 TaxID=1296100 RepID=A0A1B9FY40_9TREE|nr:rho GDP-dissociation inhibitor [Kwoniella bestiolae CBS 10118]OCF23689.1 rho GDP-dissociation inhibitor [Kwoniella bestiolae CBS 10118]